MDKNAWGEGDKFNKKSDTRAFFSPVKWGRGAAHCKKNPFLVKIA